MSELKQAVSHLNEISKSLEKGVKLFGETTQDRKILEWHLSYMEQVQKLSPELHQHITTELMGGHPTENI
jgi:hypothetical protein